METLSKLFFPSLLKKGLSKGKDLHQTACKVFCSRRIIFWAYADRKGLDQHAHPQSDHSLQKSPAYRNHL